MRITQEYNSWWSIVVLEVEGQWYIIEGHNRDLGTHSKIFITVLDNEPPGGEIEPVVQYRPNLTHVEYIDDWYNKLIHDPEAFMAYLVLL